ncbi:hypothetical protein GMRT_12537 [Giardia muris]|uniref:Uncharacterized protein n=1 Tax=Giardia muris TaxID=5742 RepID=A0A4Z1STU6_GIAMU|nr:hypothetical protein GMRT_12537 [Giardia muris]|eukprot:TNJ28405.1 hypothetical protein GMRT_12537 [Giardia muris]
MRVASPPARSEWSTEETWRFFWLIAREARCVPSRVSHMLKGHREDKLSAKYQAERYRVERNGPLHDWRTLVVCALSHLRQMLIEGHPAVEGVRERLLALLATMHISLGEEGFDSALGCHLYHLFSVFPQNPFKACLHDFDYLGLGALSRCDEPSEATEELRHRFAEKYLRIGLAHFSESRDPYLRGYDTWALTDWPNRPES